MHVFVCCVLTTRDGACDIMSLRVSPNGRLYASGFSNGEIKVHLRFEWLIYWNASNVLQTLLSANTKL